VDIIGTHDELQRTRVQLRGGAKLVKSVSSAGAEQA
jgi:hypothetical protein